jgi:adenylosuccinate synthase
MASLVIVGAQWGDEGKGKITDYLAQGADAVVRYQGGNNAGHTVVVGAEQYKLHLVPSGILWRAKRCVLGNGVVVDLPALVGELDALAARGIDTGALFVSDAAHCILPYHKLLDQRDEAARQKDATQIGTTGRGIGPAYRDKTSRVGIRVGDIADPALLKQKLLANRREKEAMLGDAASQLDWDAMAEELRGAYERLTLQVGDAAEAIHEQLEAGHNVLFEGAQGTFLDLDHGTYPYVTSSTPTAGGACVGAGVGPTDIDFVLGVTKAYTTRVGMGPFPSELTDDAGRKLCDIGHEFGTTTGRRRRTGWLDAVMLRHAVRVNGLGGLAVTKLDVLDSFDELWVCVCYEDEQGVPIAGFPGDAARLARARPRYERIRGWSAPTTAARRLEDLPRAARDYLDRIAELAGVPVVMVSVGAERATTIAAEDAWALARNAARPRARAAHEADDGPGE